MRLLHVAGSNVTHRVFFFQAEDGIRDHCVTGVQTCALPISLPACGVPQYTFDATNSWAFPTSAVAGFGNPDVGARNKQAGLFLQDDWSVVPQIGRASCRERV